MINSFIFIYNLISIKLFKLFKLFDHLKLPHLKIYSIFIKNIIKL